MLQYAKSQSVIRQPSNPTLFSSPIERQIRVGVWELRTYRQSQYCGTLQTGLGILNFVGF